MNNLSRALQFFRPDVGKVGFAFGLMVVGTSANLLKPWPLALIVDCILGQKALPPSMSWAAAWSKESLLLLFSASILVLYAGQGALAAWQNFASIKIGLRGLARVRSQVFAWLQRLSLRFHHNSSQGDLIYRLSWDTYAFQTLFQQGLFTFVQASLSLVLMILVMWRVNRTLTLVSVLIVPMLLLAIKFFRKEMKARSLAAHNADSEVTSLIQQTIVALPLIQSYTREDEEQKRFGAQVNTAYERRRSQHAWEVLYWLIIAFVFGVGTAGITWLGATEVTANRLTTGELLVFLAYLTQLYEPLNQLSHVGTTVSDASAGTQRIFDLLDTAEEIQDVPNARPIVRHSQSSSVPPDALKIQGGIRFDHVSFAYQSNRSVLHDISFNLAAGESAAIIGPSGTGKTTLLQLLPRFYDPSSGKVLLDGLDLRELRVKDLRENISIVLQEPILLRATIAENIAYGKPGASAEEIEQAALAANAHEFILRLPEGYKTVVGEGAARLSVGEKQRLNLARAFLKDAPILVLDEPTSAQDTESEALIIASLNRLIQNRTTLIVAHRLSTIRQVDKILVLEQGRLTEAGAPGELLRNQGYFARVTQGDLELN